MNNDEKRIAELRDEALASLRSSMPPEDVKRADRLGRIYGTYVRTKRDDEMKEALDNLIGNAAAAATGKAEKMRMMFVLGESNSGKSTALEWHFANRPEFKKRTTAFGETFEPLISMEGPKPLTIKLLAKTGLGRLGYPVFKTLQENEAWDLFKDQLREKRVLFLHIDEMQHIMRGGTHKEIQHIADSIKSLTQIPGWPLHLILSGVPSLAKFVHHETQVKNRKMIVHHQQITFPKDCKLMKAILNNIVTVDAEMRMEGLDTDETVHRLIHAANGEFGTMIQFIRAAIAGELIRGNETVSIQSFVRAYSRFSGCSLTQNIFHSNNWQEIDPGNALSDLIKKHDEDEQSVRSARRGSSNA